MNNVYLYVPNLICYFRTLLLPFVLIFAFRNPIATFACYAVSNLLDSFDGMAARKFKQESKLGMVLDYTIDRATIMILFSILIIMYRDYWWVFCLLLIIEAGSHYAHLYSTIFSNQVHHKSTVADTKGIIRLYYENRAVMFLTCFSHDLCLLLFYMHHFYRDRFTFVLLFVFLPGLLFKTWIHIMQIVNSIHIVAHRDDGTLVI